METSAADRAGRIRELSAALAEEFGARAAQHDRENSFPYENFARLRETGYLYLTAPTEYGGLGATLLEFCRAQERLATGCAATALATNMHWFEVGWLAEWARMVSDEHAALLREVVTRDLIFAALYSEPGAGGNFTVSFTEARREEAGYVVDGHKTFGSLSPVMTHLIASATCIDDGKAELLSLLVPRDAAGVEVRDNWDAMGMRATGSHDVLLRNVWVPEEAVLHRSVPGCLDHFQMVGLIWFQLGLAAVYTGLASAAQGIAARHGREFTPPTRLQPVGHQPANAHRLGEMEALLGTMRAYRDETATLWMERALAPEDALVRAGLAKHVATHQALRVVDLAIQTVGSAAYARKHPLERLCRDARAGTLHPFHADTALEAAGKRVLGIPLEADLR
jgi:alkylation response protein AidB-like acyl-CoA dehydrogenase